MAQATERSWQFPEQAKEYIAWAKNVVEKKEYQEEEITDGYKIRWYNINPQKEPQVNHQPQDVLVLSPHPDDAEFAAAVTMHDHVNRGDSVSVLLCTCGSAGRYNRGFTEETAPEVRLAEALISAEITGIQRVGVFVTPEGKLGLPEWFSRDNSPEMARLGVALARKLNPHILYSPHTDIRLDKHPDHHAVAQIARMMWEWGTEGKFYQDSFPGTANHLQEWRTYWIWEDWPIRSIVEYDPAGDYARIKGEALRVYRSQRGDVYEEGALGRDVFFGTMLTVGEAGFTGQHRVAAEVFDVRRVPVVDKVR